MGTISGDRAEERLNKIEQILAGLTERADNAEERADGLAKRADLLATAMSESQKTPWGPILTGLGIIMALGSYAGSFYVRDLGKTEKIVDKLEQKIARQVDPGEYREDMKEFERRLDHLEAHVAEHSILADEFNRLRSKVEHK